MMHHANATRVTSCARASTSARTRSAAATTKATRTALTRRQRFASRAPRASNGDSDAATARVANDDEEDILKRYEDVARASPAAFGGACATFLLLNRALSGVAPVADASSAQSRADVICLAMSACLVLTGLTWVALKTKPPTKVTLVGAELTTPYFAADASAGLRRELAWAWDAANAATNCDGMAIIAADGTRIMQAGIAASALNNPRALAEPVPLGPICARARAESSGNYLANLKLFPGRVEFEPFFPINAQAVCVSPIGTSAVLVTCSRVQRGFTPNDQRWFAVLAQKLDNALDAARVD